MDGNFSLYEPEEEFFKKGGKRLTRLFIFFSIIICAIIVRMLIVQNNDLYRNADVVLTVRYVEQIPERGTIYSDDGRQLAVTILRYSLSFDPDAPGLMGKDSVFFLRNVDHLAGTLSKFYGDRSKSEFLDSLMNKFKHRRDTSNGKRVGGITVPLGKKLFTAGELSQMKAEDSLISANGVLSGIVADKKTTRIYPYGNLARRTVGFIRDNKPVTGLELSKNDFLKGRNGARRADRITRNVWRDVYDPLNVDAVDGLDMYTTLDVDLQEFVENALCDQVKEYGAKWGTAIVMDVKTADVKAIANVTNESGKVETERLDHQFYALSSLMEPGSTFKTVALMSMIDDKHISLSETFNTGTTREKIVNGVKHRDDHGVGVASVQTILEMSSNIGMAMIANKYYDRDRSRYIANIKKIGIFDTLKFDIDVISRPRYQNPEKRRLSTQDFLKSSYGYSVSMSPMQIAVFYNGIANGGVMLNPRIVTHFKDKKTQQVVYEYPVNVLNQKMCSENTLSMIRKCLEGVVTRGTAASTVGKAKFKCAGKTGTANIADQRGYNPLFYYATFVGYFPADNPRYTVFVSMETHLKYPREKVRSGALLSGPVFTKIADYIYDREQVRCSEGLDPDVKGKKRYLQPLAGESKKIGQTADLLGLNFVNVPSEAEYCSVDSTGNVLDIHNSDSLPDITGFALSDALQLLYDRGFSVTVKGEGSVRRVEYNGTNVRLYLK
ncbi:MAG: hypothetical protein KBS95_08575 [Alistipes sp.]|nr:hypothetical protein [Candidatus Alistipes equi]